MIMLDVHHWSSDGCKLIAQGQIDDYVAFCLFEKLFAYNLGEPWGGLVYLVKPNKIVLGKHGSSGDYTHEVFGSEGELTTDWPRHPHYIATGDLVLYTLSHQSGDPLHGVRQNMFMLLRVRSQTIKARYKIMSRAILSAEVRTIVFGEDV